MFGGRVVLAMLVGCQLALLTNAQVVAAKRPTPSVYAVPHLQLNPSTATAKQWQLLPGVGPVLGRRLEKSLNGTWPVSHVTIDTVEGVGPKRMRQWRDLVVGLDTP
jgi:DNA uptake protein ComE-like DNA-binding protein